MDKNELMKLIDNAAQDETVKSDQGLFNALMLAYKDLDNDEEEIRCVVRKLGGVVSTYLMTHQYKAPQDLMLLAKAIQKDDQSFWKGTGISHLFW
ncbi:bacteriocin immunity protein [Companilactobacillus huachuanensis]|uniref:Bacteriocin immunity protein n=1 Tax=Companilactobacillus huachuanensis TaxID=2559914 RepID=A0ABW1RPI6_9LACO|nr:bacteriocin immunity protein [Companilactobacillus huachuanensis]